MTRNNVDHINSYTALNRRIGPSFVPGRSAKTPDVPVKNLDTFSRGSFSALSLCLYVGTCFAPVIF